MNGGNWAMFWSAGEVAGFFLAVGAIIVLVVALAPRLAALGRFGSRRAPGDKAPPGKSGGSNPRPRETPRRAGRARRAPDPIPADPAPSAERSDGYEGWLEEPQWRGENPEPRPSPS